MGRKGHKKQLILAATATIVIVVGVYLVLAYPSAVVNQENVAVSGVNYTDYQFTVGFPKSVIKVSFTVQGIGGYALEIRNSSNAVIWSKAGLASGTTTTTEWDWMPASGSYTLRVGWLASMTYSVRVIAKGAPW